MILIYHMKGLSSTGRVPSTIDFPRIQEMDLNPIFSYGEGKGSKVVDVRVRVGK